MLMIETNEYQTQVTDELLSKYSDEIKEKFIEIINTVPFVKRLINKDRKYAKDCEKDEDGKIIVDITNPHILEDMDYFRPSAIHFKQHGCYTKLKPNSNPNSEYGRWLREEVRRCWDGYVRESDGEWIPGLLYFYVNYCPIIVSTVDEKNSKVAYREEDFPSLWDGVYWRFHYLDQARKRGHHAIELARRGCGKSFSLAAIMARNFILGENQKAKKRFHTILTAYQNEYLSPSKDGTLGKFVPIIDFIAKHTQFPRRRLVDSKQKMTWQMGYKDVNTGVEMGTLNDVMGVSSKDDEAKLRGKRGYILVEEMGCHIKGTEVLMYDNTIKKVEDINIGDELIGKDGTKRVVQEKYNGTDMLYKITLSNGDWHIVNSRHPIYYIKHDWHKDEDVEMLSTAPELLGKKLDGCYIPKATLSFSHKDVCVDPYFLGLWLGDTDKCWVYRTRKSSGLLDGLRKYNLLKNKHIPNDYIYNDRDTWLQLLAGLIDSDGNLCVNAHSMNYEIIQHPDRKKVLDVAKFIATNLGLRCTMSKKNNNHGLGGDTFYRLRISGDISIIPTKVKHKQAPALEKKYKSRRNWSNYTFKVEEYRRDEFYGFTIDKDHLFVLKDLTITHNTFKNLHSVYNTVRYGVEDGDSTFGMIYLVGTANEDANDFTAAKTLLYSPKAYNIYELDNVYDKINQGKPKFGFFFPSYVSRLGCIDKNGNSDVTKALLEILTKREEAKYSIDPNTILRVIAEMPITPAEAIIKAGQNIFPIAQLTERLGQIDSDPTFYDKAYVGNLVLRDGGEVKFVPSADKVIRDFPHEDNKGMEGAIEIYNLPEKDSNGKVYRGRYIAGCLTEGEYVDTDSGKKKVEDVTFADKLVNKEGEIVGIKHIMKRKVSEDCCSISLSNIYDSTRFTGNHPIYSCTPKTKYYGRSKVASGCPERYFEMNFKFRRADSIKVGDIVKSPNKYRKEKPFMHKWSDSKCPNLLSNGEFWWFIGMYLGNGWTGKNYYVNMSICDKDQYTQKRYISFVKNTLNRKVNIKKSRGCTEYNFSYSELVKFLDSYLGKYASGKYISEWIKYIPERYKREIVLGYLTTDGNIDNKTFGFVSISKRLLCDMQDILFSVGIISNLRRIRDKCIHKINGRECHTQETFELRAGQNAMFEIKNWSKRTPKLNKITIRPLYKHTRKRCWFDESKNYIYFMVDKVDISKYDGYVYNFECDTHTYMCNYVPTHNCDPYDDDASHTTSLGSILVMDLWTDSIVAEYTGRPLFADDFYETCRLIGLFYCATINYENNKKGLFAYFSRMNCTYLLCDTLEFLRDKMLVKEAGFGNKGKGTIATLPINNYARSLTRAWLLQADSITTIDEQGEEHTTSLPRLYKLKNRALIQELINYNDEGNFDRISSIGMLMLLREDRLILGSGSFRHEEQIDEFTKDPFFQSFDKALSKLNNTNNNGMLRLGLR